MENLMEHERMWDLIRHQRAELLAARLITDEEYARLAEDHAAVERLENYDKAIEEIERRSWLTECRAFAERIGELVLAASKVGETPERIVELILFLAHNSRPLEEAIRKAKVEEAKVWEGRFREYWSPAGSPGLRISEWMRDRIASLEK